MEITKIVRCVSELIAQGCEQTIHNIYQGGTL